MHVAALAQHRHRLVGAVLILLALFVSLWSAGLVWSVAELGFVGPGEDSGVFAVWVDMPWGAVSVSHPNALFWLEVLAVVAMVCSLLAVVHAARAVGRAHTNRLAALLLTLALASWLGIAAI